MRQDVAGLVLAAGGGLRIGAPKAQIEIDGERFVDRAVRILKEAGCEKVFVVLGAWVGNVSGAVIIENPTWQEGMGSSLLAGLSVLSKDVKISAVVVTLVDLPGLTAAGVAKIIDHPSDLVAATFNGEQGHPVKFGRTHWAAMVESVGGDTGAKRYLMGRDELALVEIGQICDGTDVDTLVDLEKFKESRGGR